MHLELTGAQVGYQGKYNGQKGNEWWKYQKDIKQVLEISRDNLMEQTLKTAEGDCHLVCMHRIDSFVSR